ncbi:Ribosome-releasing factor 2, mitochondrial [Orchesella cincta]|uniref:Ribosome-releasing factor 2, mitochondrial n=1 Tax=Orchesella cincta TaxID=48709 RepID=A0A1D2MVA9_ORCCI|nr:Ribosome-releasing factor 2, mitochondrial [Orchesella cincta]
MLGYPGLFSVCGESGNGYTSAFRRAGARCKITVARQHDKLSGVVEAERVRNIGIMAHIDAGKTTTTERMLYYAGLIQNPGEVHHGDTVTDFMPQERARGITIQSAVVSFEWKGHTINLIDTPGHVDFTFEVQRSLRVVDSAVAILDASAGVEAQTLTVWRQASDYNLPRVIYLNKMDKTSASIDMCLKTISSKLKCIPILVQEPVYSKKAAGVVTGSGIVGIVDLAEMKRLIFDQSCKGSKIIVEDISDNKQLIRKRCELVEKISDFDSELASKIIERESTESITTEELKSALKRVAISASAVPVLIGSSYKNIGVQPLLDSVLEYLPHPMELENKDRVISAYGSQLCSFAFKTLHDQQLGPLTFTRIFRGVLNTGQKLYNVTRQKSEKIAKIYRPFADEIREVESASAGQVIIVSGLNGTFTGDTLTSSNSVSSAVLKKLEKAKGKLEIQRAVLSGVSVPEPVFFCSVEPASLSQQKALDAALECLQREDPSLHVNIDHDTGQTVLSGMGELHLEIIFDRLKNEFKVEADLGKLQVAYKETTMTPYLKRILFERKLADKKHSVQIELEVNPKENSTSPIIRLGTGKDKLENLSQVTDRQLRLIQNGVESALRSGPKLSFPVINVEIALNHLEVARGTSDTILEAAAASCVRECLQNSSVVFLEPFVQLEITVDENYTSAVLDDLNRRRFLLDSVDVKHGNKVILGTAPLSELLGYSTILRTISSGLGTYSMQFSHYKQVVTLMDENKIIEQIRGF